MLRVVSYNIHSGKNIFWRNRLKEMASTLMRLDADLIALQEIHQNLHVGDQVSYFADQLRYYTAYAPAMQLFNGTFGNALLSRVPITDARTYQLPADGEPRSLLCATMNLDNQHTTVLVTHFSLSRRIREPQLAHIRRYIVEEKKDTSLILAGDFNSTTSHFHPLLQDCAIATGQHDRSTITPLRKRLDYIYTSYDWTVLNYEVIHVKWSDHYPILATLKRTGQPAPAE